MRKVNFEQGSEEWLKWRKSLLTGTDAPMLMGASPYVTPFKGWQRKLGLIPEQKQTEVMRRGSEEEPIARDWFNKEFGLDMQPCCVESDMYNFIGASLDGLSKCGKYILEVKRNGDQYHYGLNGGVPEFHSMQMQHCLLACDKIPEMAFYLSWHVSGPRVVEEKINHDWLAEYIEKAREFWKMVIFHEAPPMTSKDYRDKTGHPRRRELVSMYAGADYEVRRYEEMKKKIRNELIALSEDESNLGDGLKICKKNIRGRIDYPTAIKELNIPAEELEKYRGESTTSWVFTLD